VRFVRLRFTLIDVNLDGPFANATWFRALDMIAKPMFTEHFRPRVSSTSLALAWVAPGRRAGYVTDWNQLGSVHLSAGIALCQAAGCIVSNLKGQELLTGVGGLAAASDATTHTRLTAIIGEQIRDVR
jgi:myo-inositol-1(or 4)-monophosphatase